MASFSDYMVVSVFVDLFLIIGVVAYVKRHRTSEYEMSDAYEAGSYDIQGTVADITKHKADVDESVPRCAVCDTILPRDSIVCPNCGTEISYEIRKKIAPAHESRKLEFTIIGEGSASDREMPAETEKTDTKPSGPVMIGSLKSTMGGVSSADKK